MSSRTVVVARVGSLAEASLIVGMLGAHGIDASTSTDDAGGVYPQLQFTSGVRVLVAPEDEESARGVIADADR